MFMSKNGLSCVAACGGCCVEGCESSVEDEREIEENEYENERNIFEILQTIDWETQSWEKYARQILVFVWNSAVREMFNFYFSAFFC